jgi:peptide/nickel transport system permease protein
MTEKRKRLGILETFKEVIANNMAKAGLVIVTLFFLSAIFAPWLAPYAPFKQDFSVALKKPSLKHLLGTDEYGRDVLSRVLWGTRPTLIIVLAAGILALVAGGGLGVFAGYYGGKLDMIFMRLLDVLLAFPAIILALAIISATGPGMKGVITAIAVSSLPQFARVARGSVLGVKENDYIMAARATGERTLSVICRYILPNAMMPIIALTALRMATIIILAASLSFLGLGIQPPTAEWGVMLSQGRKYIRMAPYLSFFPGLAIIIVVLGFNLLGDGLRDALDPKTKKQSE